MGSFMIFIVTMGTVMIMNNEKDTLIDADYYEKGQAFETDYKKKQAALDDEVVPEVVSDQFGATITFRMPVNYKIICKRPSDQTMDRIFEGYTQEDHNVQILKGELRSGPWFLRIEFTQDDKDYVYETEIRMP